MATHGPEACNEDRNFHPGGEAMATENTTRSETLVAVRGEWDGWRAADVEARNLTELHWSQPPGAPRAIVHGFIRCSDIVRGDLPHGCERTAGPHRLLVCILKRHNPPSVYAAIERRAREARPETYLERGGRQDREKHATVLP
jgi:hypothetical protein